MKASMLLYASHDLLLHLLLYHQSLRRQHAVKETLLSKIKFVTFFLLINCFKIMGLIHLQLLEIWHFIILIHSPIQSEHTHHKVQEAVYTVHVNVCNILYMHKYCLKVPTHPDIVYIIYWNLSVDTSYAGWQTKMAAIIDFECWK